MSDSRFWRTLAVTCVAGLFYLAHGLHESTDVSLPSLTQEVHAGDVATISKSNNVNVKIVTSSSDGRTIYVWKTSVSNDNVQFVGSSHAIAKPR